MPQSHQSSVDEYQAEIDNAIQRQQDATDALSACLLAISQTAEGAKFIKWVRGVALERGYLPGEDLSVTDTVFVEGRRALALEILELSRAKV